MILIALGANLPTVHGGPLATLEAALGVMPAFGVTVLRRSSFYLTPAIAPYAQPPFVNAVAEVATALPVGALLEMLHRIEERFGRVRRTRWGERTLDLDLLDYDGEVIPPAGPQGLAAGLGPIPLVLPHPGIAERAFVLIPLMELAPEWRHPVSGKGARALLRALQADRGLAITAGIGKTSGQNSLI